MKKVTVLFAMMILIFSCTQTKIGFVDVQEVMKDYDGAKAIEEQLKLEQEVMSKTLDSLLIPFQTKVQDFYQKAEKMSTSKRNLIEQELQQENQMLQQQQQQAQQYLQQKGIVEIEILTNRIDSVVDVFATANNYHIIIATQGNDQVMYGDDSANVTEEIIDILNVAFEIK